MKRIMIALVVLCLLVPFGMDSFFLEAASAANPADLPIVASKEEFLNAAVSDMKISIPKGAVIDRTEVTIEYFGKTAVNGTSIPKPKGVTPQWGQIAYYYISNKTGPSEAWGTTRIATTSGGPGPGTLTLGQTVTVSNSFSANVGVTAGVVSAGLGFNVTVSTQWSCSYAAQIPSGQHATINAYPVYDCYSYDVWYNPKIGDAYKAGNGSAKQSVGVAYVVSYWH